MSIPVFTNPLAEQDIREISDWYDEQRDGLGDEFLSEFVATYELIQRNPGGHQRVRKKPEVRRSLTRRFPYNTAARRGTR